MFVCTACHCLFTCSHFTITRAKLTVRVSIPCSTLCSHSCSLPYIGNMLNIWYHEELHIQGYCINLYSIVSVVSITYTENKLMYSFSSLNIIMEMLTTCLSSVECIVILCCFLGCVYCLICRGTNQRTTSYPSIGWILYIVLFIISAAATYNILCMNYI